MYYYFKQIIIRIKVNYKLNNLFDCRVGGYFLHYIKIILN